MYTPLKSKFSVNTEHYTISSFLLSIHLVKCNHLYEVINPHQNAFLAVSYFLLSDIYCSARFSRPFERGEQEMQAKHFKPRYTVTLAIIVGLSMLIGYAIYSNFIELG